MRGRIEAALKEQGLAREGRHHYQAPAEAVHQARAAFSQHWPTLCSISFLLAQDPFHLPVFCGRRNLEALPTKWLNHHFLLWIHKWNPHLYNKPTGKKRGEGLAGMVETQSGNYKFKNNYFKFHITDFLSGASVHCFYIRVSFWEWKQKHFRALCCPEPVDFIGYMKTCLSPVVQIQALNLIYNFIQQ